jgi:Flp pilus assembly pilin Flp
MSNAHERDESGQGLTEYALLIATVSLGLILLLGSFRSAIGNIFRNSASTVRNNSTIVQAPATNSGGGTNNGNNNNNNDDDDNGNNNNNNNNNGNNGFFLPGFID